MDICLLNFNNGGDHDMSKKSNTAVMTTALALSAFLLFGSSARRAQGVDWSTAVTLDGSKNPVSVSGLVAPSYRVQVVADGIVINGSDNAIFSGATLAQSRPAHAIVRVDKAVTNLTLNDITFTGAQRTVTMPDGHVAGSAVQINGGGSTAFTLTGTSLNLSNNSVTFKPEDSTNNYFAYGGALGAGPNFSATFDTLEATGNSVTVASKYGLGGAIASCYGNISLSSKSMEFSNNSVTSTGDAHAYGGALSTRYDANYASKDIELSATESVHFISNFVSSEQKSWGGAIDVEGNLKINGGSIAFSGNTSTGTGAADRSHGGAIYCYSAVDITGAAITFDNNKATVQSDNALRAIGGAIYAEGALTINGTAVSFSNNSVSVTNTSSSGISDANTCAAGGAIRADTLNITASESLTVTGNSATYSAAAVPDSERPIGYALGGAFRATNDITIKGGAVTFSNNTLTVKNALEADGAALYSLNGGVTISGSTITFNSNSTSGSSKSALGAGIVAEKDVILTATESIVFSGNAADNATAIDVFGGSVKLSAPSIEITGNTARRETTGHSVIEAGEALGGVDSEATGNIEIGSDTTERILL